MLFGLYNPVLPTQNKTDAKRTDSDGIHHYVVLGLPVPCEVQVLPKAPPVCIASKGDIVVIKMLRGYGAERGIDENKTAQACSLAAGLSDVVVLLERPRAKTCNVTFDRFVEKSKTLQAVDDLVRFAT